MVTSGALGTVGGVLILVGALALLGCSSGPGNAAGGAQAGAAGTGANGGTGAGTGGVAGVGGTAAGTGGVAGVAGVAGTAAGTGGSAGHAPAVGTIDCRTDGDGKTTIVLVNRCNGTLQFAGSDIPGGTLEPGQFQCVDIGTDVEPLNSKRYWGWIGENPGGEHHTLAEFTFNTTFYDYDWYNISHVDAHNLPMQIVPVARPDCHTETCAQDFLAGCPAVGIYKDSAGKVTSCLSPERDNPNSPVALYFEQCDDAYAWSGDDQQGTDPSPMRACAGEDWDIVFCPE